MKVHCSSAACTWVAVSAIALGCGPFFPDTILNDPQGALAVPPVSYLSNLHKMAGTPVPKGDSDARGSGSLLDQIPLEVAELRLFWEGEGVEAEEIERRAKHYTHVRTDLLVQIHGISLRDFPIHPVGGADLPERPLGDGFPKDVADYVEAARLHSAGKTEDARKLWKEILDLPAAEKKRRSLWCAWMLAKTSASEAECLEWYARVDDEAKLGGTDVLDLRAAAKSWRAPRIKDPVESIRLLYESFSEGRETAAIDLRRRTAFLVFSDDADAIAAAAADPLVRRLVNMDLHAALDYSGAMSYGEKKYEEWFTALEKQPDGASEGAAQIAWALYSGGKYEESRRWLSLAEKDDSLSLWLQAKFDLRDGDTSAAAKHLSEALRLRSADADWDPENYYSEGRWFDSPREIQSLRDGRMLAEQGVALLSLGEYVAAMESLGDAGYLADAAYIAENVISTDAFKKHVQHSAPEWEREAGDEAPVGERNYSRGEEPGNRLRWVLARRLNRERRFAEAREFVPPDLLSTFDRYVSLDKARRSGRHSGETQAAIAWEQALIHRHYGAELFSTESAPDGGHLGWNFPDADLTVARTRKDGWTNDPEHWRKYVASELPDNRAIPPVSPEEMLRVRKYAVKNRQRFHYRYAAADLAWEAAKSLPANDPLLVRLYNTAGRWLADSDPESADRFYQALVLRCAKTEEGKAADAKRWFPADISGLDSMPSLPSEFRRNPKAESPW